MLKQPLPATECSNTFSIRHSYIEALSDFPVNLSRSLSLSVAGLCFASGRTCEWHASENYEDVQAVQVAFEGWMFRIAPMNRHEHA